MLCGRASFHALFCPAFFGRWRAFATGRRMTVSLGHLGKDGRTALGNVLVKALSVPVEKACRLLLMVVAAPILGAAAFGSYQFAFATTTMLALCTDLGMGVWTTRALARDRTRAPVIVATALRLRLLASVPYLAVVALVAALAGPGDSRRALVLLGLAALVNAFVDYLLSIFRGFERLADEAHLNVARARADRDGRPRGAGDSPQRRRALGGATRRHGGERPLRAAAAETRLRARRDDQQVRSSSSGAPPRARRCRSGWRRCSRCSTSRATSSSSRPSPATRRSAPTARPTRSSRV